MVITDLGQNAIEKPGDKRKRYGYRIKIDEPDPDKRVEYILDAVGMTPAYMDFEGQKFNYGSWENIWFVKNNYPVMLKPDGTEDYRLNPKDYSKKIDGTTASTLGSDQNDNAMSAIPCCWVKRYEEDGYQYVILCQEQYDAGYKAYAHTRANGTIAPYVYHAMFEGSFNSGDAEKLRSVCGDDIYPESVKNAEHEVTAATKNGEGWNVGTWALWSLLSDLLTLMSKSTNSQGKFGEGHAIGENAQRQDQHYNFLKCGTLNDKGQFWGSKETSNAVKVFHIENFWGNRWDRIAGLLYINGVYRVKMTSEGKGYNLDGTGYDPIHVGIPTPAASNGWQHETFQTDFGRFPITINADASASNYETDYFWWNNDGVRVPLVGGCCIDGSKCGSRCLSCNGAGSLSGWHVGASLSYISPF